MKKRIVLLTMSVSLAGLLLFAVISAVLTHNGLIEDSRSYLSVYMLSYEKNPDKFTLDDAGAKLLSEETGGARVTFISLEGHVLGESSQSAVQESHSDRKEVISALSAAKEGFADRKSETVGIDLVYYCKRFDEKSVLVRIALPVDGVLNVLTSQLPLLAVFIAADAALCVGLSFLLVRFVLKPVEDFATAARESNAPLNAPYHELTKAANVINDLKADAAQQVELIKQDKQREQLVLDNMDSGLIILDFDLKPTLINASASKLLDYVPGGYVVALMADRELRTLLERGEGGSAKREIKGGDYLFKVSKTQQGIIVLITDISERERAVRSKDEFIANVTHEMNTPLTSVSGFGELLKSGKIRGEQVKHAGEIIVKESKRLQGLVKSILSYSALESQNAVCEDVDICAAVRYCADALAPQASRKKVEIKLDLPESAVVYAVAERVLQLTQNLLSNAVRYNVVGGSVTVSVDRHGDRLRLTVEDTGIGIAQQDLDKIFDRFYTADASHSGKNGGYGLGLAIVKKIARLSGWEVSVRSKEGEGAAFSVLF